MVPGSRGLCQREHQEEGMSLIVAEEVMTTGKLSDCVFILTTRRLKPWWETVLQGVVGLRVLGTLAQKPRDKLS